MRSARGRTEWHGACSLLWQTGFRPCPGNSVQAMGELGPLEPVTPGERHPSL